jgi:hypothetical protein
MDQTGVAYWQLGFEGPQPEKLKLSGRDNYGSPRQNFADSLAAGDAAQFLQTAEEYIWLSAYAANNPRSDYHWKADACYDEAIRRGDQSLYERAWHRASGM